MQPSPDVEHDPAHRLADPVLVAVPLGAEETPPPDDRDGPVLPWVLAAGALVLAALLAGALAALLLSRGGDDGGEAAARSARAAAEPVRISSSEGRAARLTAGGEDLLATRSRSLGFWVGDVATGERLRVLAVVGSRGFVIGTGAQNRIYVEFGGGVGEDEAGSEPRVGDEVDFSGPLKAAPLEPEKALELSGEPAEIVRERGAYVNAEELTTSARR